jgi:FMN phosphatase YigB (HAD superfamily)
MKISHPVNIDLKSVRNIIFDWGGVITDIDFTLTVEAFRKLGCDSFDDFFNKHPQNDTFKKFEAGQIGPQSIYEILREAIGLNVTEEQLKEAWCAMLLDTPRERIELLRKLGEQYNIYLLSNTNIIHVEYYLEVLNRTYTLDFKSLFKKVYYSHEIGMRKPDIKIFKLVIGDNNLDPAKTLFIDDTEINTIAAAKAGMRVIYLTEGLTMEKIFK